MTPRTKEQNAIFHRLLTRHKFDKEDKAEFVFMLSGERTRSSAELSYEEMQKGIDRLQAGSESSMKKMKAKIYNIARDIFGMTLTDQWEQRHYDAVDTFMKRTVKTRVCHMSYEQLVVAVTAIDAWRTSATKQMIDNLLNQLK